MELQGRKNDKNLGIEPLKSGNYDLKLPTCLLQLTLYSSHHYLICPTNKQPQNLSTGGAFHAKETKLKPKNVQRKIEIHVVCFKRQ